MYYNKCLGTPCKNEVLKCLEGEYCEHFIGKKNCERECVSLEGLGVSERWCRWDFRSTSGSQIGNRMKDGKRMREKKKDYLDPHCVLVGRRGRQGLVSGLGDLHSKPQTL